MAAVHVSVEVPEPPVMVVGFSAQERPEAAENDKVTLPVKPFTGDTVIVEEPGEPGLIANGVTVLAETEKSWTITVTVAE